MSLCGKSSKVSISNFSLALLLFSSILPCKCIIIISSFNSGVIRSLLSFAHTHQRVRSRGRANEKKNRLILLLKLVICVFDSTYTRADTQIVQCSCYYHILHIQTNAISINKISKMMKINSGTWFPISTIESIIMEYRCNDEISQNVLLAAPWKETVEDVSEKNIFYSPCFNLV